MAVVLTRAAGVSRRCCNTAAMQWLQLVCPRVTRRLRMVILWAYQLGCVGAAADATCSAQQSARCAFLRICMYAIGTSGVSDSVTSARSRHPFAPRLRHSALSMHVVASMHLPRLAHGCCIAPVFSYVVSALTKISCSRDESTHRPCPSAGHGAQLANGQAHTGQHAARARGGCRCHRRWHQ